MNYSLAEGKVRSAQILESMVEERTRALRAARARLRALLDNEPECVKLLDSQGRLLEMNAAGLRMIEVERPETVLGQCVYGIVAPEHVEAFRSLTERVCRGERGTLEFEMVGLKGTRRWLETHAVPFRDETSGETRLLSITRDVTGRKRAEQALRESERRFQAFMEHVPAAAWIKDGRLRYAYVNPTYERVYGRPTEAVLGRDDFELHAAELARVFRDEDEAILRSGAAGQKLHQVPYADGRPGHWLVVKFPLDDAAGRTGVAGIAIDVTPRLVPERRRAADVEIRARGIDDPLERLSRREQQVLQLIVEGATSAEVGALLGLSPKSVDTYRSRMMAKLEIDDLATLVKFAIRHGITSLE